MEQAVRDDRRWRVAKKLLPGQAGTLKLARRYGDQLLCVRYRLDERGQERCTTVELIVERVPVVSREDKFVAVRIALEEAALRAKVKQHGAAWDPTAKVWRLSSRAVARLGLRGRVVETA